MMSIVKQASMIVECAPMEERAPRAQGFQASQELRSPMGARYSTAGKFAPNKLIGLVSACEKFLARETGTIHVFVVGLCRGRPNQLDWRTQLLCAKQSS
jgi:hypothetical protein